MDITQRFRAYLLNERRNPADCGAVGDYRIPRPRRMPVLLLLLRVAWNSRQAATTLIGARIISDAFLCVIKRRRYEEAI